MILLPVLLLVIVGVVVLATSASEKPRVLPAIAGLAGGLLVLLVIAVVGVGVLRGSGGGENDGEHSGEPATSSTTETTTVDRQPDAPTQHVEVPSDGPVAFQQCGPGNVCGRPRVVESEDGIASVTMELERRLGDVSCRKQGCVIVATGTGTGPPITVLPVSFEPVTPRPTVPPTPTGPTVHADVPDGRTAAGLAAALVLLLVAGWLIRRRPDERAEDPFWGVSIDVPEWDGVDVILTEDEMWVGS